MRIIKIICLILLLFIGYFPQAQDFTKIKQQSLFYDRGDNLQIELWRCKPSGSYFIRVCNKDETQCSPVNCTDGMISSDVLENDFSLNAEGLIKKFLNLNLSTDSEYYSMKLNELFAEPNFSEQLHIFYATIKDSIQNQKVAKKKPVAQKKKSLNSNNTDGENPSQSITPDLDPEIEPSEQNVESPDDAGSKTSKFKDSNLLNSITVLSAINFDFVNNGASFLGLFNIYAPHAFGKICGVMTGIEKINYSAATINNNDSSRAYYILQNLVDRFDFIPRSRNRPGPDSVRGGAQYHAQFKQYTYSNTDVVWSFYFDPMVRIGCFRYTSKDNKTGIFLNGHFEFLVNEWTRITNFQTLADHLDTAGPSNMPLSNAIYVSNSKVVSNFNFLSSYIGLGLTFYYRPFPGNARTHMFFQPAIGVAINSPAFDQLYGSTAPPSPNGDLSFNGYNSTPRAFYLIRSIFLSDISDQSQLIVGFSIRGLMPTKYPQYAAYLGLNIGLSALTDLFSDKKK